MHFGEGESPMVERLKRKTRSESKVVSSAPPPWGRLFGHPNILEGEDAAAYEDECAPNDAEADDKLDKVLRSIGLDTGTVLNEARALRARELVQEYVRREPDTVVMINELLTAAGASIDGFMADALAEK